LALFSAPLPAQDFRMQHKILAMVLLYSASTSCFAHVRRISPRHAIDPSYAAALAAANHFLHAWQTEDHEAGIVMLTDSAREHATTDQLQNFFSPGPQAAYEIARGKRVSTGAYSFPVVLFGGSSLAPPRSCSIVVTRAGKNDWAIDKLP
jgi:hypothetical protein